MSKPPTNSLSWQPFCPRNPEHGRMLDYENDPRDFFFCPHAECHQPDLQNIYTPDEAGAYNARKAAAR